MLQMFGGMIEHAQQELRGLAAVEFIKDLIGDMSPPKEEQN